MIDTYYIGVIAQLIFAIAVLPYIVSIFRGTVKPNRVSWFIWSVIGFAFWLITPSTADEVTKMMTVVFVINPMVIFLLTLFKGESKKPDTLENISLFIGIVSIVIWYFLRDNAGVFPISIAVFADFCALLPTLRFVFTSPQEETPLAWILFFIGSLIAVLAIENHNLESLLLPVYMTIGSLLVAVPLVHYRLRKKIPMKEWII